MFSVTANVLQHAKTFLSFSSSSRKLNLFCFPSLFDYTWFKSKSIVTRYEYEEYICNICATTTKCTKSTLCFYSCRETLQHHIITLISNKEREREQGRERDTFWHNLVRHEARQQANLQYGRRSQGLVQRLVGQMADAHLHRFRPRLRGYHRLDKQTERLYA